MTNMELNNYIRNEWKNDMSWLAEVEQKRSRRTRVGLFDLLAYLAVQRRARRQACC